MAYTSMLVALAVVGTAMCMNLEKMQKTNVLYFESSRDQTENKKATCCADHTHCCPQGYTCDVSAGTCKKGDDVVSWLTKVAAKPVKATVTCPDKSECPDGNTCCKLASGRYGCCPLKQ
ncbi:unnamed protein product, partial [Candidula unifasciata]